MIAIVDYRMGNLRSVQKALQRVSRDEVAIVADAAGIDAADKLVLPGVGAFADAIAHLHQQRLTDAILRFIDSDRPFLGICLGMQMLFEIGEEDGEHQGLGVLRGRVVPFRLADAALKVPHMGWNALTPRQTDNPLMAGLGQAPQVYFVHGYFAAPDDADVIATTTDYGGDFCSAVHVGNVFATQFHPEKSQRVGLRMLANFASL